MTINVEENKKTIIELLERVKREGMDKVIKTLEKTDYFVAPASISYHLNVPGGLAQHSLCVYQVLSALNSLLSPEGFPDDSIIIVGLLHDVCKVGLYIPKGNSYRYNNDQPPGHGDLSVKRLKKLIQLTDSEEMMIRWHMNKYDDGFVKVENTLKRDYPEVLMSYFADHFSSAMLED